jgi:hypothetical protein
MPRASCKRYRSWHSLPWTLGRPLGALVGRLAISSLPLAPGSGSVGYAMAGGCCSMSCIRSQFETLLTETQCAGQEQRAALASANLDPVPSWLSWFSCPPLQRYDRGTVGLHLQLHNVERCGLLAEHSVQLLSTNELQSFLAIPCFHETP